jgi:hypothetical protein
MSRLTMLVASLAGLALTAARATEAPAPAVVHEWGTFTSIAGPDGRAVEWTPQAGASDLPCFVARNRFNSKGNLRGTVRMETPVLYFYAPTDTRASVRIRFNGGVITEWYPPAAVTESPISIRQEDGTIAWNHISIVPGLAPDFPIEPEASHYYQARETDAAPVVSTGGEQERFLFYRGVGTFAPPLSAAVSGDGSVLVTSPSGRPLGDLIMFENRNGAIATEVHAVEGDSIVLAPQAPQPDVAPPLADLERILITNGLFEKEAHAMVETWRDSWFEEGARLIYIVPAPVVDAILPLEISPSPSSVTRVFVGRLELVTPATLRTVAEAIAAGDRDVLDRYGRFLEPIVRRLGTTTAPIGEPVDRCR